MTSTTIDPLQAILLGLLEGLTEFVPVSSTGHLILASHFLGLTGETVKTFQVVIQAGALGAVLGLYRTRVASMWRGLLGQDAAGRALFVKLMVSFLPTAAAGLMLHKLVKARLFGPGPVVAALALGGLLMVAVDRACRAATPSGGDEGQGAGTAPARTIESITIRDALLIGCAQCTALWPGTSRAMATIVTGSLLGLPATVAAEYSFLLALPTMGAATLFDAVIGGQALMLEVGLVSLACGFLAAAGVATLAIRGFIQYLGRHGLAPFGWYRLGLALLVWMFVIR